MYKVVSIASIAASYSGKLNGNKSEYPDPKGLGFDEELGQMRDTVTLQFVAQRLCKEIMGESIQMPDALLMGWPALYEALYTQLPEPEPSPVPSPREEKATKSSRFIAWLFGS